MKNLILISLLSIGLVNCATTPKYNYIVPAPALREVFRGGEIQGLESNEGQYLGRPGDYDLTTHTCISTPIFGLHGEYIKTSVKCW